MSEIKAKKGNNGGGNPDWKPGVSGNPTGRPKGARTRFGEDFVNDFMEHWKVHGKNCLDDLANNNSEAYARVAIAILPKIVELGDDTKDILAEALSHSLPFEQIRAKAEKVGQAVH